MAVIGSINAAIIDRRWFPHGQAVCRAGEHADGIWLILKGSATLALGDDPSAHVPKTSGSMYGDIECLLDIPYEGTLTVTSPSGMEAARLSAPTLKDSLKDSPKMIQAWVHLNAIRVLKSGRRFQVDAQALDECHSLIDGLEEMLDELLAEEPKN